MRRARKANIVRLATVLACAALCPDVARAAQDATQHAIRGSTSAALTEARNISAAFEQVAQQVTPSVVSIESARKVKIGAWHQPQFGPDAELFLRRFFGENSGTFAAPFNQEPQSFVQEGLGSGVIVTADGYILTNNHVVAGADEVTVKLSDDRTFTAKVVGADPKTDLAVLKVDADHLAPATLGDAQSLRVGEWVLALGNPFGLRSTMTAGIVSAKGRSHMGIADYEDFIQTDAAINPGNSGGPLVDLDGNVIGINTAIATRNGGYMGVGFAVPIDLARSIMRHLIDEGHVVRGWLGVGIQDLTDGLAKSFHYDNTHGALVADVVEDGPGAQAGLQPGDIIIRFGSREITNMDELRSAVAATRPGTHVSTELVRDGHPRTVQIAVGELAAEEQPEHAEAGPFKLGLSLQALTPELAQQLGYEQAIAGVVAVAVEPLSPADRAGLQPRDVIVAVQYTPVRDLAAFNTALGKADLSAGVRLTVRSGTLTRFVLLQSAPSQN